MAQQAWFITGISSGFGREMTEQLLERGDRVAGTVRNLDSVRDLTDRYGDRFWSAHLEMTDLAEVRRVVDAAFGAFGRIDVVVNNAGYGLFGAAEEFTDEQVVHEIGTNLLGSIQVVRSALPHLRAQHGGRIIQLSTFGGLAALPGGSMYHAGKWGIEGFCEALMIELAPFNIGVTLIEPGGARTSFRRGSAAQIPPALDAYAGTPAAGVRGMLAGQADSSPGDPAKMAEVIIGSANTTPAPRRIVLGSDSYGIVVNALTQRLADVQGQKESAAQTDFYGRAGGQPAASNTATGSR
jgi:NAD(P)-dependent dehydrogenase (short-subunit alcohol dehydrogenase family)